MNRFVIRIDKKKVLVFVLLVCLVVLAGGNTLNPDIYNYSYNYQTSSAISEGCWLYFILNRVFLHFGASYRTFRVFLYLLGFTAIHVANKKLTDDSPLFYVCYIIALVMIDTTQTYNFVGLCFMLLGIAYLIKANRYNKTLYIVCLIIASGFHIAYLFYLPFIFFYRRSVNKQLIKLYIVIAFFVVVLSTVMSVSGLARLGLRILSFLNLESYQSYLNSRTRYGHFYPMMTHLVTCTYTFFYYWNSRDREGNNLQRICFLMCLYGIFAFPFFRFQLVISRLTRNLGVLAYISGIDYSKNLNKNRKLNVALLLLMLSFFLGYFNVYSNYIDEIVKPFFSYNWILGLGE